MRIERPKSNPASTNAQLRELNQAFYKAAQAKNFAECERLKAEINAVLDEASRSPRFCCRECHE